MVHDNNILMILIHIISHKIPDSILFVFRNYECYYYHIVTLYMLQKRIIINIFRIENRPSAQISFINNHYRMVLEIENLLWY